MPVTSKQISAPSINIIIPPDEDKKKKDANFIKKNIHYITELN
jgi:hypothetical protein